MPPAAAPQTLHGVDPQELKDLFREWGEPAYRADQVLDWVWKKRAGDIAEMTNLPASLREKLARRFTLGGLTHTRTQGSEDTTRKFLFQLADGRYVECVLIPASPALYGERSDRRTLCVSSQVGCAYGCRFCASGLDGLTRNLTPGEITGQIILAEKIAGKRINNLVFMGMGEPLANLPNLLKAIEAITSPWGIHIGARHLTISTSGLAPQIRKLADHPRQIRLAISLHGATDEVRDEIMPVNRKWPLEVLFDSLHYWNERKKQKLTFEYILIEGVNDDLRQAELLARRARNLHAKVNLIPYNTVEGLPWVRPDDDHCRRFRDVLKNAGIQATLRIEKGHDIDAACGQLRLKEEQGKGPQAG